MRSVGESHGGRVIFENAERTRLNLLLATCGRSVCPLLEATRPPPAKLQHLRHVLLSPVSRRLSPKETATTNTSGRGWRRKRARDRKNGRGSTWRGSIGRSKDIYICGSIIIIIENRRRVELGFRLNLGFRMYWVNIGGELIIFFLR